MSSKPLKSEESRSSDNKNSDNEVQDFETIQQNKVLGRRNCMKLPNLAKLKIDQIINEHKMLVNEQYQAARKRKSKQFKTCLGIGTAISMEQNMKRFSRSSKRLSTKKQPVSLPAPKVAQK